jgi:ketosteroid isomerase-like protein
MSRWSRAAGLAGIGAVVMTMGAGLGAREDALSSLVAAERAFAKMSVDTSQREAFLAYFADEGVWFVPGPRNTKESLRKQPPSAAAPGRVLDWDPVAGDVAASGDLGYTTGPWIASERGAAPAPAKPVATGWFFSVWQRSGEAGWKVVADFGVNARHARVLRGQAFERAVVRASAPAAQASSLREPDAADAAKSSIELRAADVELARRVTAAGWAEALRAGATSDVRTYRDGHEPVSGRQAAVAILQAGARSSTCQPSFARASNAGDLGFTYGAYTEGTGPGMVRGYYLHVWKRVSGRWKLAVHVANVEGKPLG